MATITVRRGDTLRSIAERTLGDQARYAEIAEANGIKNPNKIRMGTTLTIPDPVPLPRLRPDTTAAAPPPATSLPGAEGAIATNVARGAPKPARPGGVNFKESYDYVPASAKDQVLYQPVGQKAFQLGYKLDYGDNAQNPQTSEQAAVLDNRNAAARAKLLNAPLGTPDYSEAGNPDQATRGSALSAALIGAVNARNIRAGKRKDRLYTNPRSVASQ